MIENFDFREENRHRSRLIKSLDSAILPSIVLIISPEAAAASNAHGGLSAEIARLWPYHASFALLGFAFLVWGMAIARRKDPGWLNKHRILEISGAALAVSAMVVGACVVSAASQEHFRVPHAYLGAFVVLLLIVNTLLGHIQLRVGMEFGKKLRRFHRLIGRSALLLMALNILFGMIIVGSA